jgi:hypothetical protein
MIHLQSSHHRTVRVASEEIRETRERGNATRGLTFLLSTYNSVTVSGFSAGFGIPENRFTWIIEFVVHSIEVLMP